MKFAGLMYYVVALQQREMEASFVFMFYNDFFVNNTRYKGLLRVIRIV